MKIVFTLSIILCLSLAASAQNSKGLNIKFKAGVEYQVDYAGKKIIQQQLQAIPAMNNLVSVASLVNRNLPVNPQLKGLELIRDIHFIGLPVNADIDETMNRLINTGLFEYVEKDAIGTGAGVNITPNDPNFNNLQWSLKNLGTFSGTAVVDADIDMDQAWDISTGNASTVVCVLDAGFKLDHPELSGRIWQNAGEIAGNSIDDDGNGYIDDVQGWDWANSDNNPTDDHGHGSNVGSIIAAKGNNASGMAGINWNCKLMVGKVLNSSNSGFYSWWESGIYYAVNKGAKVINMSVGGSSFSATMQSACDFAKANNVIILACMHNQNTSAPYYPAAYASVIAVGSTSDNDVRTVPFPWSGTSGSNYGSHIDLIAPGNNILGINYLNNTSYNYWAGTSQATPEVAGVVSLMFALKPNLTFTQVLNILSTTSQDQVGNPAEDTPGWDQYYGFGRLNANAALNAVLLLIPVKFGDILASRNGNGNKIWWNTFAEYDTKDFIVEYSTDRTNWQAVGQVAAAGNSQSVKNYSLQHLISDNVDAYYRIRILNIDGSSEYSRIAMIRKNGSVLLSIDKIITGRSQLAIYTTSGQPADCLFSLYSIEGKLVSQLRKPVQKGSSVFTWDVDLAPGRYQLGVIHNGQLVTKGLLVN